MMANVAGSIQAAAFNGGSLYDTALACLFAR